jgi:hypothetical protein
LARACLALGLGAVALAVLGLGRRWPAVEDQAYLLAWVGTLLALDAVVHLRAGRSLLLSTPRAFLLLAAHSASFWLLFELLDLRLANWHYVGVPPDPLGRSLGCFATVLPALLECADLVRALGLFERARHPPLPAGPRALRLLVALGLAALVLPLVWPRLFFPLVWGFAALLVEPWLFARGERGLLERLAAGDPRRALELLAGGLLAGLFWELYNAPAVARWVYTVPGFVSDGALEMPWAGFLGFPPFALEGWSVARALVALGVVPEFEGPLPERPPGPLAPRRRAALLGSLVLAALALALVNLRTVRSTDPTVRELRSVDAPLAAALEARGLRRVRALLAPEGIGALAALEPEAREAVLREARLLTTAGLGLRGRLWLEAAGAADLAALAEADPQALAARFERFAPRPLGAVDALPPPRPSPPEVGHWVRGARRARTPRRCPAPPARRARGD